MRRGLLAHPRMSWGFVKGSTITINFDGDESQFFTGGWSEVGGNVLNDKIVLGGELFDNGNFAAWTLDDPDDWDTIDGNAPASEISEVGSAEGHGGVGTGSANIFRGGAEPLSSIAQTIMTIGEWNLFQVELTTVVSGTIRARDAAGAGMAADYTTPGTKLMALRAISTVFAIQGLAGCDITIDDATIKPQTLSSLLNALKSQFGLSDGFFIDVHINAVTVDTQVGAIWNYDGSNNFGMAYMDGTNLVVDKNVAGTYSNLASVAQAVTQDQILRIENPAGTNVLDILYNGVSKATPTISDASVIGNTGIALFSTEANNAISKVTIGKL